MCIIYCILYISYLFIQSFYVKLNTAVQQMVLLFLISFCIKLQKKGEIPLQVFRTDGAIVCSMQQKVQKLKILNTQ